MVGDRGERRAFGDSAFPVGDSGRSFVGGNVYPAGMWFYIARLQFGRGEDGIFSLRVAEGIEIVPESFHAFHRAEDLVRWVGGVAEASD